MTKLKVMTNSLRVGRYRSTTDTMFPYYLFIDVFLELKFVKTEYRGFESETEMNEEAKVFVEEFLNKNKNFEFLRSRMLTCFKWLQNGDPSFETIRIPFFMSSKSHVSCTNNNNKHSTTDKRTETEVPQSELKQKLASVKKNSKILKFFDDNKCSICLSTYKEILDDNFHIVASTCGHVLCCHCADNILKSKKKECPQCRENFTTTSFDLMIFNADLEIDKRNQKLFL